MSNHVCFYTSPKITDRQSSIKLVLGEMGHSPSVLLCFSIVGILYLLLELFQAGNYDYTKNL